MSANLIKAHFCDGTCLQPGQSNLYYAQEKPVVIGGRSYSLVFDCPPESVTPQALKHLSLKCQVNRAHLVSKEKLQNFKPANTTFKGTDIEIHDLKQSKKKQLQD